MRARPLRTTLALAAGCAAWLAAAAPASGVPIPIYVDANASLSYDPGEELPGGANLDGGGSHVRFFDLDSGVDDLSSVVLDITFDIFDNNFEILVNGVTVVPLDGGDPAVFTPGIDQPWIANDNSLPRLRMILTATSISFEASLTNTATTMTTGLVYAQTTVNPVFVNGQNTLTVVNPDGPGPDALIFAIAGDVLPVPEPDTALLLGLGLAGLVRIGRPRQYC
jgi:hypothetical protein